MVTFAERDSPPARRDTARARPERPAASAPQAGGLSLQGVLGNRAVAQMLADANSAIESLPAFAPSGRDATFPAESIVDDLRRAIDQSDPTLVERPVALSDRISINVPTAVRHVDFPAVVRSLDNLTAGQVARADSLYKQIEGRPLEEDLLGSGASNLPTDLEPEQVARIRALLQGTRAERPSEAAPQGRIDADAVELHDLLAGDLDEEKRERVMALQRRPEAEIDHIDAYYIKHYERDLAEDLDAKLSGLQRSRVYELRSGNWALADACAIEDKRRALEALDAQARVPLPIDVPSALRDEQERRRQQELDRLIAGIGAIVELNRREALADPANISTRADQAVQQRLARILATPAAEPGTTLGSELERTLGPVWGGAIKAAAGGSLVEAAARRLIELETTRTTTHENVAAIVADLREQAKHDALADPWLALTDKVAIASGDPGNAEATRLVDAQAQLYVNLFLESYERLRDEQWLPIARPWAAIVASATGAEQERLTALAAGGGRLSDLDELDVAIRNDNAEGVKAVLRRQRTPKDVAALARSYVERRGRSLRQAIFGPTGNAELAERWESPSGLTRLAAPSAIGVNALVKPLLRGRDAALANEWLGRPEAGGQAEVGWIAGTGHVELTVTEARSGAMGWLRELGDLPESQEIMRQSEGRLRALQGEWRPATPGAARDSRCSPRCGAGGLR